MTTPPVLALKLCRACRKMADQCRCRRTSPDELPEPEASHLLAPKAVAPRASVLVDGLVMAAAQMADAGSLGILPADVRALVRDQAGRAGLAPAEWLARAARAYAQEPASAAERQRAARERRRMERADGARAGMTDHVALDGDA